MPPSEASDDESDWSTSDAETLVQRTEVGTAGTVTYKGTVHKGKVAPVSDEVPSDIVPLQTCDGVAVWCRDPGDGTFVSLSRSECRKVAVEVLGKGAKSDAPTDADIAACIRAFGTGFPVQMKAASTGPAVAPPKAAAAEQTVEFKYNKQQLSGVLVSFAPNNPGANIRAVNVASKGTTSGGVFWVTPALSGPVKHTAMTVTEAKRAVKSVLGRSLGVDGPSASDDQACIDRCGTPCPVQLHDARVRNERAKHKRAAAPCDSVATTLTTGEKRKGDAELVYGPANKKRDVARTELPTVSVPNTAGNSGSVLPGSSHISVTLTGDAATLLPALAVVFGSTTN